MPVAEIIALSQGATLDLVYVATPPPWSTRDMPELGMREGAHATLVQAIEQQGRDYLEITSHMTHRATGLAVETTLLEGSAAGELLDYEERAKPDLLVMATHGYSGIVRFVFGSVAERVLREGRTPILLVRAGVAVPITLASALVPLDGSQAAEAVLPLIRELAGGPLHRVELFRAVPSIGDRTLGRMYLEEMASELRGQGLAIAVSVKVGHPAELIAAATRGHDLLVLTTHGHGDADQRRRGRIAEQLLRSVALPTLLARPGQGGSTSLREDRASMTA